MLKEISYNNKALFYTHNGLGKPVVLLHGLCEDATVWDTLTRRLEHRFRVACVNLPGNGKSAFTRDLTIDDMAAAVVAVLDNEKIDSAVVIGHSMGGYVALAMADKYPERLKGLGLFHSYALADDDDKKAARDRSIDFIKQHGRQEYIKQMFNNLFDETFKAAHQGVVNQIITRAINRTTDESVIHTLLALRNRPDRTYILEQTPLPVLFIAGKNDTAVPFSKLYKQMDLPKHTYKLILDNVNHMGMYEQPVETSQAIIDFAEACLR